MRVFKAIATACLGAFGLAGPALAQLDFDTRAPYAVLMDYESGTFLYQKNADDPIEPASMAKLMTLAVVFDRLKSGNLRMEDEFFISEHAWRTGGAASGGSTMFAELNSQVSVANLLRSVIIQSGNDAAIALAWARAPARGGSKSNPSKRASISGGSGSRARSRRSVEMRSARPAARAARASAASAAASPSTA